MAGFQTNNKGGNAAGVVLEADNLSETDMLAIAKDVGYSETAFVMNSSKADVKVRFFTSVDEVDLCGHATISTFNLLRDMNVLTPGIYTQETNAGILEIDIQENLVYMEQPLPVFGECLDKRELYGCFDITQDAFVEEMPIQIVSTGLRDIILPIRDLETLYAMKADSSKIRKISERYDVVGIHAFALETIGDGDAHTRNFAPRFDIDEESATGTSNGALACYLSTYTEREENTFFEFEQGYCMNQPSKILANVQKQKNEIKKVYVGGEARRL